VGNREVNTVFWWVSERKRPFGRPRSRWEDKIKNGSSRSGMSGVD